MDELTRTLPSPAVALMTQAFIDAKQRGAIEVEGPTNYRVAVNAFKHPDTRDVLREILDEYYFGEVGNGDVVGMRVFNNLHVCWKFHADGKFRDWVSTSQYAVLFQGKFVPLLYSPPSSDVVSLEDILQKAEKFVEAQDG